MYHNLFRILVVCIYLIFEAKLDSCISVFLINRLRVNHYTIFLEFTALGQIYQEFFGGAGRQKAANAL